MMVLKFIATKDSSELVTARDICTKFKTPFDSTAKVMQKLNSEKILVSAKGIKGGYAINKSLSQISYLDLVKIIEGNDVGRVCITSKGDCENLQVCNIVGPVEILNKKVASFLGSIKLEQLLFSSPINKHIL